MRESVLKFVSPVIPNRELRAIAALLDLIAPG